MGQRGRSLERSFCSFHSFQVAPIKKTQPFRLTVEHCRVLQMQACGSPFSSTHDLPPVPEPQFTQWRGMVPTSATASAQMKSNKNTITNCFASLAQIQQKVQGLRIFPLVLHLLQLGRVTGLHLRPFRTQPYQINHMIHRFFSDAIPNIQTCRQHSQMLAASHARCRLLDHPLNITSSATAGADFK